ncbi:MAG: DUF2167 domain-containing protein [Verrucomicrobiales bacterium]|nr:DUF2167 domain-containing protein [Verrucomicrobiales bacterium]
MQNIPSSLYRKIAITVAGLAISLSINSFAQTAEANDESKSPEQLAYEKAMAQVKWQTEGVGKLGSRAEIKIPENYGFTDARGSRIVLEANGNIPGSSTQGMLVDANDNWIVFSFDDCGYVKDDEKDDLDADAMLENLQANNKAGNEERKRRGMPELIHEGWVMPPKYNEQTHNLEWGVKLRNAVTNHTSINYSTRLLGREGYTAVALVCSPEELDTLLPEYQRVLQGFSYTEGQSYAEYRQGDKLAEYGLAALVVGGAAVGAAKMGLLGKLGVLFAKLGKAAFLIVAGIAIGIKKFFSRLFGRAQ